MRFSSLFVAGLVCGLSGTAMSQTKPPSSGVTSLPSTTTSVCSTTTWPNLSPVPCMKPRARNYAECTENVVKNGNSSRDAWWWCSNLGFKN